MIQKQLLHCLKKLQKETKVKPLTGETPTKTRSESKAKFKEVVYSGWRKRAVKVKEKSPENHKWRIDEVEHSFKYNIKSKQTVFIKHFSY